MSKFFFHMQTGNNITEDDEGVDLPDVSAVRELATESAREIMAEAIRFCRTEVPDLLIIADENGREVLTRCRSRTFCPAKPKFECSGPRFSNFRRLFMSYCETSPSLFEAVTGD
jgi:hypothetical protein